MQIWVWWSLLLGFSSSIKLPKSPKGERKSGDHPIIVGNESVNISLNDHPVESFSLFKRHNQVDWNIKPGQSFYHFANNHWLHSSSIPDDKVKG
jgi:hypothetical protein